MIPSRRRPDFFIVGAPKSGTTALYHYLRQHPDVFMPGRKDVPFFGTDLQLRFTYQYGRTRETLDQYLEWFAGAGAARRVGEASVWYLYSRLAAAEIRDFAPNAAIIVMLRNPVDMLHAQHSQFLTNLNEDIEDFSAALAAEEDRRQGRRIPPRAHLPQGLQYRDTARYAEQLERYFRTFGRERVHVIVYDDFKRDTARSVRATLEFLGVDPSVHLQLDVVNPNKVVRNRQLQALVMARPGRLEAIYHSLTPRSFHGRLAGVLRRMNLKFEPRPPLDPVLRERLEEEMKPEVERLGVLLDRDLSFWSAQAGRRVTA